MHSQNIAHRDIKLENILIDTYLRVKIIDFGFSINFENKQKDKIKMQCGTPCYMAPELVSKKTKYYDPIFVDVWALGVLLYRLLFGTFPFKAQDKKSLFKIIIKGEFEIPKDDDLNPDLITLIKDILVINPK